MRVEALPTDRKGRPWDPATDADPSPDLEVRIVAGDVHHTCKLPDDRLEGRCTLDLDMRVDAKARIDIEVVDRDTLLDDPVGDASLTDPSHWGTDMLLPMMPSGRLRGAAVVLEPVATPWTIYRFRLLGLAAGVGAALVAMGGFRRAFFPPPPPKPTCAHCNALLPHATARCANCGAVPKADA